MASPRVSIVITAYNYADYLRDCLDSALSQTYDNYEVIVVDDGSTDNTPEILREYEFEYPDRLRVVRLEGQGLPGASNAGIRAADGKYIVRLDADDMFDENILTVEANYLDANPSIDLIYPDYYTIDKNGDIIDHVRLPQVEEEVKLLNRSPLAAGAMYRRDAWDAIGGYDEGLNYQEDYDFWIRFINQFSVQNVNLPLMYYRQHSENMSQNLSGRLEARNEVKKRFVDQNLSETLADQEVLCVIPARGERRIDLPFDNDRPFALQPLHGRPIIEYSIAEGLAASRIDRVVVSTEDEEIAEAARNAGADVPRLRPSHLSESKIPLEDVMLDLFEYFEEDARYDPDVAVVSPYISPLRTADHLNEAVDTWNIFSVDSVISVTENDRFLWQPGEYGLDPLFDERLLREEREALYQENGAIYVFTPRLVQEKRTLIGNHVGHVLMERENAVHVDSSIDFVTAEQVLKDERLQPSYCAEVLGGESQ